MEMLKLAMAYDEQNGGTKQGGAGAGNRRKKLMLYDQADNQMFDD